MTAPEVHEALAEVLAAHGGTKQERTVPRPGISEWHRTCLCGEKLPWGIQAAETAHRLHLARVLADHFAEAVTEARARELREAADAIRDVRENGLPAGVTSHPYSELFERWLLARADSLAPEAPSEVQR